MSNSNRFASADLTAGQLNAIVKKLGGHDMALRFLRDELTVSQPSPSWREEDSVIYFSVTSDGTTRNDWIERFHVRDGERVVDILRSPDFEPTNGVTTEVAVLKGRLFEGHDRITEKIRAYARAFRTPDKRRLGKPNAELTCLVRKKFTDKDFEAMGLGCIVAMHEPINDSDGNPDLLSARGCGDGDGRWLDAYRGRPSNLWDYHFGFAFEVLQANQ